MKGPEPSAGPNDVAAMLESESINDEVLRAELLVKRLAGEVNFVIHAVGILLAMPHILEPGEEVLSASLGAGTWGRLFDLETTQRVAEFKFTRWRGHDAVRQRELFADFVALAETADARRRQLFVAGADLPHKFLRSSKRKLTSVCERRPEVIKRIVNGHGEEFDTVADYFAVVGDRVQILDLHEILPAYVMQEIDKSATVVEED